jgi:alkanesulfonate monooxygenase SsuD/methylene tetrahydromethanopterin reductase-like flavin-dependent oxidoreductase (luciferase family)
LYTSVQQQFINLRRGVPGKLHPPVDTMEARWTPAEEAEVARFLECSVVGSPATVKRGLEAFIARTKPDEVIVTGQIYDHAARLHSFEILADVHGQLQR